MKFVILLTASLGVVFAEDYCRHIYTRKQVFGNIDDVIEIKPSPGRVFFTQSGGQSCHMHNCRDRIMTLRSLDIFNNYTDIRDNFYIGGDGYVYTGLGWEAKNLRYPDYKNDLSVVFIGDFTNTTLPEEMQISAKNLVLCGVSKRYIDYYFSIYSESDLLCSNNSNATNGIDEALSKLTTHALGGKLVKCPNQLNN